MEKAGGAGAGRKLSHSQRGLAVEENPAELVLDCGAADGTEPTDTVAGARGEPCLSSPLLLLPGTLPRERSPHASSDTLYSGNRRLNTDSVLRLCPVLE